MEYIIIVVLLIVFTYVFKYVKNQFDIKQEQIEILHEILLGIDYITSKVEFKYKESISTLIERVLDAIDYIEENEKTNDVEQKKILIKEKAVKLCVDNNIEIDNGLVEIVDLIVDYYVN